LDANPPIVAGPTIVAPCAMGTRSPMVTPPDVASIVALS